MVSDEKFRYARGVFLRHDFRTVRGRDDALRAALEAAEGFVEEPKPETVPTNGVELAKMLCKAFSRGFGIPIEWDKLEDRNKMGYIEEAKWVLKLFTKRGLRASLADLDRTLTDVRSVLSALSDEDPPPKDG